MNDRCACLVVVSMGAGRLKPKKCSPSDFWLFKFWIKIYEGRQHREGCRVRCLMPMKRRKDAVQLTFDQDRLDPVSLYAAYEISNAIIQINLELRALLDLKPTDMVVLHIILAASAQKTVRKPSIIADVSRSMRVPDEQRGTISRRAISEALDLPLETVRRSVKRLSLRGFVEETGRGKLVASTKILEIDGFRDVFYSVARRWISATNKLLKQGAVAVA